MIAEEEEQREAWFALRAAVHDYSKEPTEPNSASVSKAVHRLRVAREQVATLKTSPTGGTRDLPNRRRASG